MYTIKKSYIITDCSSANILTAIDQYGNSEQLHKVDINSYDTLKSGDILYLMEVSSKYLTKGKSYETKTQFKQFFIPKNVVTLLL